MGPKDGQSSATAHRRTKIERNIRDRRSLQSKQNFSRALHRFRKEKLAVIHKLCKY